ncbi:MAG: hypothetical protein GX879_11680 [Bacteroidales bacterium]|nr:hypothetical protein [Bacteroidales bacterium]
MKHINKTFFIAIIGFWFGFNFSSLEAQNTSDLLDKYSHYRDRLLNEFVVVSNNVEEFGVNIPATDRVHDKDGKPYYISWGDGNCNFNHYLGFLATEYRLLKNNNEDYTETYKMLIYTILAIERLDLYSEYVLRKHNNIFRIINGDTIRDFIVYPDDFNGFLIRDDVSLGFWVKYAPFFGIKTGNLNKTKDGTNTYLSVFQKGVVAKEEMSQDNIVRMLHALALVKRLVDTENENIVEINYINDLIPKYLKDRGILADNKIYIDRWVDDLTERFIGQIQNPFPQKALSFKPWKGKAAPVKNQFLAIVSTRWYILNKITDELVAEGSGDDLGVWLNSYGFAEAGNAISGEKKYHFDGSNYGVSKYLFKSLLFKNLQILPGGAVPIPKAIDDYMFRDLAVISDVNRGKKSYELFFALRDRRHKRTYEHQTLMLYLLHTEKYSKIYNPKGGMWHDDKAYYANLLAKAPQNGPFYDLNNKSYSEFWNSSSRLIWPGKGAPDKTKTWEFAGMDYLFLHNLYRLVFEPKGFNLNKTIVKKAKDKPIQTKSSTHPNFESDEFYYEAPRVR